MNICVNCVHYNHHEMVKFRSNHRCALSERISPVTGERDLPDCAELRDEGGECGPEGRLFGSKLAGEKCGQEVQG